MNTTGYKIILFFWLFASGLTLFLPSASMADPLDNWYVRNTSQVNALNEITYGNNTFVAVGSGGTILTSPDGIKWTSRISGTTNYLSGITYGNNTFVAVGYSSASFESNNTTTILTSPDGVTWTIRTSETTYYLYKITYGNNIFVAMGRDTKYQDGLILTSPDGVTWTTRASNMGVNLNGLIYGNNIFVAVGHRKGPSSFGGYDAGDGIIRTSLDGITWTEQTSGTSNELYGITYGNNIFVAVGDYRIGDYYVLDHSLATILTSTDGVRWTDRSSSSGDYVNLRGITYGNGNFVAFGFVNGFTNWGSATGEIITSSDTITWTKSNYKYNLTESISYLTSITYGNGIFIGVAGNKILQSANTVPLAENKCAASVSPSLVVHIPIVTYSGLNYWADLQYNSGDATLTVAGVDKVTDLSPYSNCTASSLTSDFKLHIPVLMLNGISYMVDLTLNGSFFVVAGVEQNSSSSITISGATSVDVGQSIQLTASAYDADGNLISNPSISFQWSSSDTMVATVNPTTGLDIGVAGVRAGSVTITVTEFSSQKQATAFITVNAKYTDNGNGTISDSSTGLMWQKGENPSTYNWYVASGTYDAYSNPSSQNVCGSLSLGGQSGWRLPSKTELLSLVDKEFDPTIDNTYFPNTHLNNYWSSTTNEYYSYRAYFVPFDNGYVYSSDSKVDSYYVRCVRG